MLFYWTAHTPRGCHNLLQKRFSVFIYSTGCFCNISYKSQKVESNIAKVKTLEAALEIIPVNQEIVEIFGMLKSNLEKTGKPIDDFDLILASTVLTHNLILVTNNEKHFKKIEGLKLENWTKSPMI